MIETIESLETILSEHPFFKDLGSDYLSLLTGCASNIRFDKDKFIFHEGENAREFYLIRKGRVLLQISDHSGNPITIQSLHEGDILGWSWLFPPYNYRFDALADELTLAIALDGKCLRDKCEENHDLGYDLVKRFTRIIDQRLQATRIQLLDIYGNH